MLPGLGKKYSGIEIETITRPFDDYHTEEYYASGLPIAPAIVIDGKTAVTGDISQDRLEALICQNLGMAAPEVKKGFSLGSIFGRR